MHHFPGGAADGVCGLLQYRRDDLEHVAHHRRNKGNHHHRENDARGEHTDAVGGAFEQWTHYPDVAEDFLQQRLHVVAEQWREHEQTPHAVNDRRDRGQKLYCRAQRPLENRRTHFGEEKGDAEAHRDADQQGDGRCHQRSVNRGERSEFAFDRVPDIGEKEPQPEPFQRR